MPGAGGALGTSDELPAPEKPGGTAPSSDAIPQPELPSAAAGPATGASNAARKSPATPVSAGGDASGGEESGTRRTKKRRAPILFQPNPQPTPPPVVVGVPRGGAAASPAVRGQNEGHRPGVRLGGPGRGAVQALQEAMVRRIARVLARNILWEPAFQVSVKC